jgi:hypothetical protein
MRLWPEQLGQRTMRDVSDLPRPAATRTGMVATLPIGFVGRTAPGFGKRTSGRPAEIVAETSPSGPSPSRL